jgi:hypothetical protein
MKPEVTVELRKAATTEGAAEYLVKRKGYVIGILEKYTDTATDEHPWKAFRFGGILVGFFFGINGKKNAIDALKN